MVSEKQIKKFDPKTLHLFDKILVRNHLCMPWRPDFYDSISGGRNSYGKNNSHNIIYIIRGNSDLYKRGSVVQSVKRILEI